MSCLRVSSNGSGTVVGMELSIADDHRVDKRFTSRSYSRRRNSSFGFHRLSLAILNGLHMGQLRLFLFSRFRVKVKSLRWAEAANVTVQAVAECK